jgi:TonB family protein
MMRLRIVLRFGGPSSVASRYLAYSLGSHAFLLIVLVLLPSFRGTRAMSDTPLMVDLVSFPSPAQASAPAVVAAPPPSEPVAQPEGVSVATTPPKPVADDPPVEKPKPKPEPKAETEKPPRTVRTPPSEPVANPAPGEPAGVAGDAGASVTAMEGVGDFELGWYKGAVTAALFAQWRKPILEGITEPREVRVTFQIQRDGRVTGPQVDGASGVPSLDRSALRAVADASPLPPLPPNWREPTLFAAFVFRLYPE